MSLLKIVNTFRYDHGISFPGTSLGMSSPPKLVHDFGFDRKARFQMLQVGSAAKLSSDGGDPTGMHFELRPATQACKIVSQDMTLKVLDKIGMVVVEGVAPGTGHLVLVDAKGKVVDQVDIEVVAHRAVITRFYNLIDSKGRRGIRDPGTDPTVSKIALSNLIDEIESIVLVQCGVAMAISGEGYIRDLNVSADLGNRIDLQRDVTKLVASSDFDRAAQFHVAFGWDIDGGHPRGSTMTNVAVIRSDLKSSRSVTLAHEFVHFLSGSGIVTKDDHDSESSDLLFKSFPHGIALRRDRLKKIIH
ncbi:MAG TPA: hypothetical protein VGD56_04785 [Gemmatirosa sp.]